MKTFSILLFSASLVAAVMVTSSCDDERGSAAGPGALTLSFKPQNNRNFNGRVTGFDDIARVFVSIETAGGETILNLKEAEILTFGEELVSSEFEIPAGDYSVTMFMACDAGNNVLYATPTTGSRLAALLVNPLPLAFSVKAGEKTALEMEVVSVENFSAADFGYATFYLKPADQTLLTVIADAGEMDDVTNVKAWVLNRRTYERQWVQLVQDIMHPAIWQSDVVIDHGDYEVEAHVHAIRDDGELKIAYRKATDFTVSGSTSIEFEGFEESIPFRLHEYAHHTVLTSMETCDMAYHLYLSNDLKESYFYVDRFFHDGTKYVAGFFDEVWICDSACPSPITPIADTGYLAGTLDAAIEERSCQDAEATARVIDGMIIVSGMLDNGELVPDSYEFMTYKFDVTKEGRLAHADLEERSRFREK